MPTKVDFSRRVKEVLNRNNVQIRSLEFLDPKIKEQFLNHRKKAILLIHNKVFEREINSLGSWIIDIFDNKLSPYLKKGQLILVVLPTGGPKRYVLQTKVVDIYVDRFRLIALDPRDTKRFSFPRPVVVKIRPVGDATAIRIQSGEVRVVRHIDGVWLEDPGGSPGPSGPSAHEEDFEKNVLAGVGATEDTSPVSASAGITTPSPVQNLPSAIKDILCKGEGDDPADDYVGLAGQAPVDCTIVDISCGGMCVSRQHGAVESFFVDQLLAVECAFAKETSPPAGSKRLNLMVFAVVRNKKNQQGATQLNLQFLANLPKAIVDYW